MTWTQRRKLAYSITTLLLILAVVGYIAYKNLKHEPTCFDGKQNGTETGMDCGGKCTRVCEGQSRNIVVLWARPFEVAPGVYNVVAYFENQNVTQGIQQASYEFKVYDKDNILVAQPYTGTTFIGPNQRSAIFISGVQTGNRIPETVFFRFTETPKWDTVDQSFGGSLLIPKNQIYENLQSSAKVTADITNASFYDLEQVPVVVVLYDASGNAYAASQTLIEKITQGSTIPVTFTWLAPFATAPVRIEIIPRVNPFLSHGR